MKRKLLILAAMLVAALSQARDIPSPDGKYTIRAEEIITLVDVRTGQTLLVLSNNTAGATRVEVAWAPDSRKIVMVENYPRGSVIFGAWTDSSPRTLLEESMTAHRPAVWHKTLQADADESTVIRRAEQKCGGRLVSEKRVFAGWISSDAIRVKGEMQFSSGERRPYQYTLQFLTNVTGHLDKGGYEGGVIMGRDHRLL
jgi:hypothetical protein